MNSSNSFKYIQSQGPLLLLWAIFILILLCAISAKIILFRGLAYTSDLFNSVQSAKSLLQGRSIFFANDFGPLSYNHNNFLLLPLSPFVWFSGAYAFLILSVGLVGLAGLLILREARALDSRHNPVLLTIAPFTILVGPIAFWLFDDPLYGWHIEFLYLPLALLFTFHLLKQSRMFWLWAVIMVLCKEDGAVVACSLHLAVSIANCVSSSGNFKSAFQLRSIFELAKIALIWLAIFAIGMIPLAKFAAGGGARLTGAWQLILAPIQDPNIVSATVDMFSDAGVLVGSTLLALSIFMGLRYALLLIIMLLPCLVINYISAAMYASEPLAFSAHGLDWPARFVLLWGILGGVVLCAAMRPINSKQIGTKYFIAKALASVVLIWAVQDITLDRAIDYKFFRRASVLANRPKDILLSEKLSKVEQSLLQCLAKTLPTSTAIATEPLLYGYFHNHDVSAAVVNSSAWRAPDFIVCERRGRISTSHSCIDVLDRSESAFYQRGHLAGIELGFRDAFSPQVNACLASSKELATRLRRR